MFARVPTTPYTDQKPGTSGLRKRVRVFEQPHYTANFVQATFNALRKLQQLPHTLLIGGDGRYYSATAIAVIVRLACANGVRRVWVAQHGLMSTPAVSTVMRRRGGGFAAQGAFILTASHNPGGAAADFGIKYNSDNGGPAPERLTTAIYAETLTLRTLHMCTSLPELDVHTLGVCYTGKGIDDAAAAAADNDNNSNNNNNNNNTDSNDNEAAADSFVVEVIDPLEDYVQYMQQIFDFVALRRLLGLPGVRLYIDAMHGASGPYVKAIFHDHLHVPLDALHRTTPLDDFGGAHPDPNLTYAHELVHAMGLLPSGLVNADMLPRRHGDKNDNCSNNNNDDDDDGDAVPFFGAAFDGDADRNMILGRRCFVNPSDSLAVLAANAHVVPYFRATTHNDSNNNKSDDKTAARSTLRTVARSMPTSRAVDRVAAERGLSLFEVPTGWKFFGNLMDSKAVYGGDDYTPLICGEESFGTGSCHIREKDGIWAALFWLSILADANGCNNDNNNHHSNSNSSGHNNDNDNNTATRRPLVGVQDVMERHWSHYGRCYALRYDYEDVTSDAAAAVLQRVRATDPAAVPLLRGRARCVGVDDFCYTDPVDASVSRGQGVRVQFDDGSRFVLRLSGTGSCGATIRLYLEQYMDAATVREHAAQHTLPSASAALQDLVQLALHVSAMRETTGRDAPTVIT